MADIFISYARADRDRIEKLASALEGEGWSVWWDRDLTGGEEFSKEIERELTEAKAVIVAWSAHGSESPWVRDEASLARQQTKLFPITLDKTNPPLGFQQYHTFDFSQWRGAKNDPAFQLLTGSIRKKSIAPAAAPAPAPPTKSAPPWRYIAAGAGIFVAAMAAFFLLRPDAREEKQALAPAVEAAAAGDTADEAAAAAPIGLGVIPFVNFSSHPEQEYFADGLTEELLNWLANVEGLNVPGRTASFQFKGGSGDFAEIGKRLGVRYLLEGSVRRSGDDIRITAQLIEAETGYHLWSETYDRKLDDIFAIQDEVAQSVVTELLGEIPASGADNPAAVGDVDPRAHELYLQGRALWSKRQGNDAFRMFRKAVETDPDHWLAQAYLAVTGAFSHSGGLRVTDDGQPLATVAENALAEAEALRPDAADVLFAKGWVTEFLTLGRVIEPGETDSAVVSDYESAVRANPRHVEALHALARLAKDDDASAEIYKRIIEIEPGHTSATVNLADYYNKHDRPEKANDLLRKFTALVPENAVHAVADTAKLFGDWKTYFEASIENLARKDLTEIETRRIAMTLADLGHTDESAALFKRAADQVDGGYRAKWIMSRGDLVKRDFSSLERDMREAMEMDFLPFWMPSVEARTLLYIGKPEEALDVILKVRPDLLASKGGDLDVGEFDSFVDINAHVGALALEMLGRHEEAAPLWQALLKELDKPVYKGWRRHVGRAMVFAQTGKPDQAFNELDQAFDAGFRYPYSYYCAGCVELDFYNANGFFGPILDDPRFGAYVARIEAANRKAWEELEKEYEVSDGVAALIAKGGE